MIALLVSPVPPLHGTGRSKRSKVGVPGSHPRTPFDWRGRRAYTVEQVGAIAEILDRYGALTWPIVAATKTVKISSEADQLQQRLASEYLGRLE